MLTSGGRRRSSNHSKCWYKIDRDPEIAGIEELLAGSESHFATCLVWRQSATFAYAARPFARTCRVAIRSRGILHDAHRIALDERPGTNSARRPRGVLRAGAAFGGWKLVVVDNGSTDETATVIADFANRLPLQSAAEPTPGKNAALNTGLALAEGDLIVFTDDDVFPNADWLVQLRRAADEQPGFSVFGGSVVPRWEVPPPHWISWLDLGPIFTITPKWMTDGELEPRLITLVQGPNMAVRASYFQSGARFDTSIGPRGTDYPMGSETELLLRLARQGYRAWHVKGAVIEHFVRQEQLEKPWILRRAIRYGRGHYRLNPGHKLWGGVPRHLFYYIPKEMLRIVVACVTRKHEKLLRARWHLNYLVGMGIEARIMARERDTLARSCSHGAGRQP